MVYLNIFLRVDKRYWVPNGSSKVGNYSGGEEAEKDRGPGVPLERKKSLADRVLSEEQVFDLGDETEVEHETERERSRSGNSIEMLTRNKGDVESQSKL